MASRANNDGLGTTVTDPSNYLFGRAVRIVSGCLAVMVSLSQAVVLSIEEFACPRHFAHWDHLGSLYQGVWPILLNSLTEWQVMPGHDYGSAAVRATPIVFLGSLGFVLAFFAKKTWCYPRVIVFVGCLTGFLLVPALGLLETIKTFRAFGSM
jgi:hypothetical protein